MASVVAFWDRLGRNLRRRAPILERAKFREGLLIAALVLVIQAFAGLVLRPRWGATLEMGLFVGTTATLLYWALAINSARRACGLNLRSHLRLAAVAVIPTVAICLAAYASVPATRLALAFAYPDEVLAATVCEAQASAAAVASAPSQRDWNRNLLTCARAQLDCSGSAANPGRYVVVSVNPSNGSWTLQRGPAARSLRELEAALVDRYGCAGPASPPSFPWMAVLLVALLGSAIISAIATAAPSYRRRDYGDWVRGGVGALTFICFLGMVAKAEEDVRRAFFSEGLLSWTRGPFPWVPLTSLALVGIWAVVSISGRRTALVHSVLRMATFVAAAIVITASFSEAPAAFDSVGDLADVWKPLLGALGLVAIAILTGPSAASKPR